MYKKYGELISNFLGTDQSHYVEQQADGSYRKKAGLVNSELISQELHKQGSIAIYQKNNDLTIKWICFDFDILKKCIESGLVEKGKIELEQTVCNFCHSLEELNIPFLLEYSGNRGFHVWITFDESINYRTGYDIQQSILKYASLDFDNRLIGIDLFPHSTTPTGGVGLGVKIPLSKHKKSGCYSYLLSKKEEVASIKKLTALTDMTLTEQIHILESHLSTNRSFLEKRLGIFFESYESEYIQHHRIKQIKVNNKPFSLETLLELWRNSEPLRKLTEKIESLDNLTHKERKLIVGLLCSLECKNAPNLSSDILHQIFSKLNNYNSNITNSAIQALKNFNFPTQEKIENTLSCTFEKTFTIEELLKTCIPNFVSYTDANFEFSNKDIEITRAAELNYLFMNDEVQAKVVIEELSSKDNIEFLTELESFINGSKKWGYYKHERNEGNKKRELVTLNSNARVATSCILKQISYYLDIKPDGHSHGYQINKGFDKGYIFKPWLYLWLKFISNITDAIENECYNEYYIIKTDINRFYNSISHDSLKRLLQGDGDSQIKDKIQSMRDETLKRYKKCLQAIFNITEEIVGDNKGLPQGPAYARFFAELYLSEIDEKFKRHLINDDILLYERYVDDIFFVTKSKSEANNLIAELSHSLNLLNLTLNNEKTIVSKISSFHEIFDKYRSQSKYAVDQISKTYVTSTDKQKDNAINEFVKLIQSDSCQDDLSFIFSHLDGVKELNDLKTEQMLPALQNGIGRGSLFKNLFNFLFELNTGWEIIYQIEKFDALQSEVLTSCIINSIETNKEKRNHLIEIFKNIEPKITYTTMVSEHIAYLITNFKLDIDVIKISPEHYLSALTSLSDHSKINASSELISHLDLYLNDIKSMSDFIKVIYVFCFNDNEVNLQKIASLFFAKMSIEEKNHTFSTSNQNELVFDPITTKKFYYLLCLFSTSNENRSTDLIASMWKYCTFCFNILGDSSIIFSPPNWLDKLNLVKIDNSTANWIISSIVDGNIFRGISDDKKIFEQYHNALLVYLSMDNDEWRNEKIEIQLNKLKLKSNFYNWLIDNRGVSIFPTDNKKWFERNIIENGITALQKGNKILIRKPSHLFLSEITDSEKSNGFSELIVDYDRDSLISFRRYINDIGLSGKLEFLTKLLNKMEDGQPIPSIFCPGRVIKGYDKSIFSIDFCSHAKIISVDEFAIVSSCENTISNFIDCFLSYISENSEIEKTLKEKYFNNLSPDIDKFLFIIKFYTQITNQESDGSNFYIDIAIATSLYLYLSELDPISRLESFSKQYSKFHNNPETQHIFIIEDCMTIDDSNLSSILCNINSSLSSISQKLLLSVPFYLHDDIIFYRSVIEDQISNSELDIQNVKLEDFKLSQVNAFLSSRTVKIDNQSYAFSNVKIINPKLKEVVSFDIKHLSLINGTEHIYTYQFENIVYIISLNSCLSVMYSIIRERYKNIVDIQKINQSYPSITSSEKDITSLAGFDDASFVVKHHNGISALDADGLLIKWLQRLPCKFHIPLITLIKSHECMQESEIQQFIKTVKEFDKAKDNIFLIKNVNDYNGTHRILYRDDNIGRGVPTFTPSSLTKGATYATLIADLVLTGYQVIKALRFYLKEGESKQSDNYFEFSSEERNNLLESFQEIETLNICTVLYTHNAIVKIQNELREILNTNIVVQVVNGRDISENAFFGSTTKIPEHEKYLIKQLLLDDLAMTNLYEHLSYSGHPTHYKNEGEINKMNLVARYKSLPKKSFDFLRYGSRSDENCKPFNKILELTDKI